MAGSGEEGGDDDWARFRRFEVELAGVGTRGP